MIFRIKHESRYYYIYPIVGIIIIFIMMISPLGKVLIFMPLGFFLIMGFMIYNFASRYNDTLVGVDDYKMTVQYLFHRRQIELSDIADLRFENYTVRRSRGRYSHYTEYRVALTIQLTDGKKLELTDIATQNIPAKSFFSRSEYIPVADESTELYKLYRYLTERRW